MAEETKLQDMIRTSLESIRAMIDANTVVGTPIQTAPGTTIIPISKISVAYASGGLDFGGKASNAKTFGGGGGIGEQNFFRFIIVGGIGGCIRGQQPAEDPLALELLKNLLQGDGFLATRCM